MNRLRLLSLLLIVISISCGLLVTANAAPATSAFTEYPTFGLTMLPDLLQSGQLTYTVSLSSGAYLQSGGVNFPITQVWGVYAVNKSGLSANDITASGSDNGDWSWDQHPVHGTPLSVAGWLDAPKKQALLTPASGSVSKAFTFTQFAFTGTEPVTGYHVTISVPQGATSPFSGGLTGDIIVTPPPPPDPVPEPTSGLMLLTAALGVGPLVRSRKLRS